MRLNYKKLGPYIEQVNIRNKDLAVDLLLGVSIQKILMPSIANTVGTNMKTYKVIKNNQFAYGPVTSRNGDKISIALLEDFDEAIVSQAYTVFKVIYTAELLPEYLMMWFRRPEFDRYARFKSHGSARETFDWDELCEVELPIPSPAKQQEIVDEYNAVVNRIKLNEDLTQKLEETAQTLYKHWFVDFEFPMSKEYAESIGKPELEGKPYKANGGEMVFCTLLEGEVPTIFRTSKLEPLVVLSQGIQVEVDEQYDICHEGFSRFVRIIDYTEGTDEPPRYIENRSNRYFASVDDIVMIRYGDAGTVCRRIEGFIANNLFKITPNSQLTPNYLFYYLKNPFTQRIIKGSSASSTMPAITHKAIKDLSVVIPTEEIIKRFDSEVQSIEEYMLLLIWEMERLKELRHIIIGKMAQADKVLNYEVH